MSRPFKCRRICEEPKFNSFAPLGVENAEKCMISVDEYEAVRLIDLEKNPSAVCWTYGSFKSYGYRYVWKGTF